jgi:multiple sugar transport system substrate-binding protein
LPDPEKLQLHNWEDLQAFADQYTVTDSNGLKRQYGLASTNSYRRWLVFLLQNRGSFVSEDGTRRFSYAACAEALQYFTDLVPNNLLSPEILSGTKSDHFLFQNNRVAMIMSSYYFMNDLQDIPIRWDVLPSMPGNKTNTTLLISSAIGIPASGGNNDLALSFARMMFSYEAQSRLKMQVCSIPAYRSVAEDVTLFNPDIHPEHYHAFIQFLPEAASLMELGVSYTQLSEITLELIYLWARMETAEEAWTRIQNKILTPVGV